MTSADLQKLKYVAPAVIRKVPYDSVDRPYVGLEHIEPWTGQIKDDQEAKPEGVVSLFEPNDILFGKLRPYLAKVALAEFSGACSTEALVLRPRKIVWPPYLRYVLSDKNFIDKVNASTFGAKMPRASWDFIGSRKILLPNFDAQKTIANFLDRETARIGQLIEKRESFLSLVDEKKAALNALAVNGSILGSSSDGERGWFGKLPSGWEVRRGKFLFRERDTRSVSGDEELLTVSHITGVTSRAEKEVNMFLAESMEGYKLVFKGDVAINTMWAWMGALGVSPLDGLISPSYGVYLPIGNHFTFRYLDLLLRSRPLVAEINRRSKGVWSSRLRLYADAFLDIPFPEPTIDVQNKILATLDSVTERENRLAAASFKSLDRLREFRGALISAAVTGQIDLKSWNKRAGTDLRLDEIEEEMTTSSSEHTEAHA